MSARRNTALTIAFPVIDTANRPDRLSGASWTSGGVQVSKDGGSFTNATNTPAEIGSSGRYSLAITATEMDASWVEVKVTDASGSGAYDDTDIMISTTGNPSGSVQTDAGNTTTTFKTSRTESVTDYWKNALLTFTTGSLIGQVRKIDAFNGTSKVITVNLAFTSTPSSGDRFVLIEF